jgi:hypothetical protein
VRIEVPAAAALLVSLLSGAAAAMCSSAPAEPAQSPGREITLAPGASARVPNTDLTIAFEQVVEDSRCPVGTTCVWAGDAAIALRVERQNAAPARFTLHTDLPSARDVEQSGSRIGLVSLTPRPTAAGKPRPEDYRATLSIESVRK